MSTVPPFRPGHALDERALDNLRALSGGDSSFLNELITIFLEDTPPRLTQLAQAIESKDSVAAGQVAHALKGSCSNFGADNLRALAAAIEKQAKQNEVSTLPDLLGRLQIEYTRVHEALVLLQRQGAA